MQRALEGGRVLRRVLRRGSKKSFSRRRLEGRNTPSPQVTVCGVTVCPFSRHKGNHGPKCLKTSVKCTCHEIALSDTRQTCTWNCPAKGPKIEKIQALFSLCTLSLCDLPFGALSLLFKAPGACTSRTGAVEVPRALEFSSEIAFFSIFVPLGFSRVRRALI